MALEPPRFCSAPPAGGALVVEAERRLLHRDGPRGCLPSSRSSSAACSPAPPRRSSSLPPLVEVFERRLLACSAAAGLEAGQPSSGSSSSTGLACHRGKRAAFSSGPKLFVGGIPLSSEVVKEFLGRWPELCSVCDSSNTCPLYSVAVKDHLDVVNAILDTDDNCIKIVRKNGKTSLHTAARIGYHRIVKALIERDPGIVAIRDRKGQTALHMVVKGKT